MKSEAISEDIRGQLLALEARQKLFTSRLRQFGPAGLAFGVAAVIAGAVGYSIGPDAYPSSVHVPEHLFRLFSDTVPGSSGSGGLGGLASVTDLTTDATSMLMPMVWAMAAIAGVFSVVTGLLHGEVDRIIKGVVLPLGVVGMFTATNFMLEGVSDGGDSAGSAASTGSSPRAAFMEAVADNKFSTVQAALAQIDQSKSPAGLYVLAQVMLSEDSLRASKPLVIDADLANKVAASKDFKPREQALYAIELAAFSEARSPQAIAYRDDKLASQASARATSIGFGIIGAALGAVGIGFGLVGRVVSNRMKRIHNMLGLS